MTDQTIEQAIQAAGKTAPRIKPSDVELAIASENYFTAEQGVFGANRARSGIPALSLLTICVLVLRNGYTVTGESACASAENFDAGIGRRIAREKAVEKIWPLLGYQLRDELYRQALAGQAAGAAHP